jgi:DNA-directed RNA polymerase subunit L
MNIEILEEKKNMIRFKIVGEDHTIVNLLKEELWNDKDVKIAAYKINHPLIGTPEMTVEVNQGSDAKKAIEDAVKRLTTKLSDLKELFKKNIK